MCICKYCNTSYSPRAQVKNPKACNKRECQEKRQRENEKNWHEKHNDLYSKNKKYHQEKRVYRHERINEIIKLFMKALLAGLTFCNEKIDRSTFDSLIINYFRDLGIRQINKFWNKLSPVLYAPPGFLASV